MLQRKGAGLISKGILMKYFSDSGGQHGTPAIKKTTTHEKALHLFEFIVTFRCFGMLGIIKGVFRE